MINFYNTLTKGTLLFYTLFVSLLFTNINIYGQGTTGGGGTEYSCEVSCNNEEIDGFTYAGTYSGKSYYISNSAATWNEAELLCNSLGGHLPSISSQQENDFINSFCSDNPLWIGLSDQDNEGQWAWTNGSQFVYDNWLNNQPDDGGSGQDQVVMDCNSGKWDDAGAPWFPNEIQYFIMEIECPNSPITMYGGDNCELTLTLDNLIIENPRCAEQYGYIHFDLNATDSSGNPVIINDGACTVWSSLAISPTQYSLTSGSATTSFTGSNAISGYPGTYIIQISIFDVQGSNQFCNTNFTIPTNLECCNENDENDCMANIASNTQKVFTIEADYEPIEIDWILEDPPCSGQEGYIQITDISGGGCTDISQYNFSVNSAPVAFDVNTLITSGTIVIPDTVPIGLSPSFDR